MYKKIKKEKISLMAIFSIALIIRLAFIFFVSDSDFISDEDGYDAVAVNLLQRKGFFDEWGMSSFHPPLYSLFLYFVHLIFGHSYFWVIVIQAVIDASTCLLVYFIVKRLIKNEVWAVIAGLFSCFYLSLIAMSTQILSECLFTFLFTLSILFLLNKDVKPNFWNKIMGGVTLGLATLTRSVTLIFPIFIFFWLFFKYRNIKRVIGRFFVYFLFFILTLTPWTIRNYIIHHAFVPVSTAGGATFWGANNPWAKGEWVHIWSEKGAPTYSNLTEVERDRAYFKEGLKFLKSQTLLQNIKLIFLKIWWFVFPLSPAIYKYDLTFAILFPFCLYGMWIMRKSNSILFYIMANFLLGVIIFSGSPRIRAPASPFIISFGIIGLKYFYEKLKNKTYFCLVTGMWMLLNFTIFILDTIFNFDFLI